MDGCRERAYVIAIIPEYSPMRLVPTLAALLLATPAVAALAPGAKAPDFTTRGAIAG